ncbi:UNVERIFIED_CONTAM: hypothetical protein FKN15_038685 [Acipenser sinensis]
METEVDVPVETEVRPEVKDISVHLDGEPESGLEPVDVEPTQDTEPKEGRIPPVSEPEFTEPRRSGREVKPIVRLTYDAPGTSRDESLHVVRKPAHGISYSSVQLDGEPESGLEPVDVDPTQDTEPKEGRIPPVSEPEFTEPRRSGREVKPIVRLTYDSPGTSRDESLHVIRKPAHGTSYWIMARPDHYPKEIYQV